LEKFSIKMIDKRLQLRKVDTNFKYRVLQKTGGERLTYCFSCGACTGSCPTHRLIPELDPQKIIHMIMLGFKKDVLSANSIWDCSLCHTCDVVCPQDVRFSKIILVLRQMAWEERYVDRVSLINMGKLAMVHEKFCSGCLVCMRACPFEAIFVNKKGFPQIEWIKCRACGICVVECPAKAIEFKGKLYW